jgi:uncharacterized protein YuzE
VEWKYDSDMGAGYVRFVEDKVAECITDFDGLVIELNSDDEVIGLEIYLDRRIPEELKSADNIDRSGDD